MSLIKRKIYLTIFGLIALFGIINPLGNFSEAGILDGSLDAIGSWLDFLWGDDNGVLPQYEGDFANHLTNGYVIDRGNRVSREHTLRENIIYLFYPNESKNGNDLYKIIRDISLGIMIIFIVRTGGSLLLNKKPEESKKHLTSLLYILLGGIFIYAANRLFGSVLHFSWDQFTPSTGIRGVTKAFIGESSVLFLVLSAIKAFAFFLAIIMIVITGFKVIAAGEGEKGKKLMKGLINVVVALLIIKGVDFIYYLVADSKTFIDNASDFIINTAKVFAWIYGVIVVIMVIVAGYLYITDGGSGNNFKKATNVLINILLSALILFGFLLITYQIFAEFQSGGDAVSGDEETGSGKIALTIIDNNYI